MNVLSFAAKTDIKAMASLTSSGRGRSEIRNIKLRSNTEVITVSMFIKQLLTHYTQKSNHTVGMCAVLLNLELEKRETSVFFFSFGQPVFATL